jgi:hypothetical protein
MSRILDVRKVQEGLDRAAKSEHRDGRFRLKDRMLPVNSSMMTDVHYHEHTRELDITFTSGKKYRYRLVPPEVFTGLLQADSQGKFFNEVIKDAYRFAEVSR